MINIFRKIRQNLLKKGKTSRYLKYAFGEIVLVVLGILIALQINNWNENRINSHQEETILLALKREFVENQMLLSVETERHAKVLRLLKELSDFISPKPNEVKDKKFDYLMFGLSWLPHYTPKDGVINSIISSGKISLIKNSGLSSKLSSWTSLVNQYETTYQWTERDVFEQVLPYILNKYPYKRTLKHFGNEISESSTFEYSKNKLLSDMKFENLVANRRIDASDILNSSKKLYSFQDEVLAIIENELNK